MFSGIVNEAGVIKDIFSENHQQKMSIFTKNITDIVIGSSISCAGVCLTATDINKVSDGFIFDVYVSPETLSKTTLKTYRNGSRINLERSLCMGDEISGHMVQGHVDTTVKITKVTQDFESTRFYFELSDYLDNFIVPKGSVSLDGTSLTVNEVSEREFGVSIIPYTKDVTTWNEKCINDFVNIEVDMYARYIRKQLIKLEK